MHGKHIPERNVAMTLLISFHIRYAYSSCVLVYKHYTAVLSLFSFEYIRIDIEYYLLPAFNDVHFLTSFILPPFYQQQYMRFPVSFSSLSKSIGHISCTVAPTGSLSPSKRILPENSPLTVSICSCVAVKRSGFSDVCI